MVQLRISSFFAAAASRLPKEARAKLPKVFMLLTSNPRHPSLQVKKVVGASRTDVYECRVNGFWRIILRYVDDTACDLLYVGAHDEALRHGMMVRERAVPYSPDMSAQEQLEAFLEGEEQAIRFLPVTIEQLNALAN
jgi:mRNA-degrading endonuclease RelE of RelBE toxin-antitoxin system